MVGQVDNHYLETANIHLLGKEHKILISKITFSLITSL